MAFNINLDQVQKQIQEYLNKSLFYYDLAGLAVGISTGPSESEKATFVKGYSNAIEKTPLEKHHVFHMASVSKLFVGTSLLKLWEDGQIDLDGRLSDYLPDFEMVDERYREITIKQLLSHTSAMPDVTDYRWYAPETDDQALKRFVYSDEVKKGKLLWKPGQGGFAYSNIAYEILGHIIAKVSGLSFEEYVEKNIFRPLKMYDSDFLSFKRDSKVLASPHEKDQNNHMKIVEHYPYNRAHAPSSTLTSTLDDLSTFAQSYMAGKLLAKAAMDEAWKEYAIVENNQERICLSWFKREQNDQIFYGHEGNDDGFRASFWLCPKLNLSITVCSNLTKSPVKRINRELFDLLSSI